MTATVHELRRTYRAKRAEVQSCGCNFIMSGTLDGYCDLVIEYPSGSHAHAFLDPGGLRLFAAAAIATAEDIERNCLYDRDPLLMNGGCRP